MTDNRRHAGDPRQVPLWSAPCSTGISRPSYPLESGSLVPRLGKARDRANRALRQLSRGSAKARGARRVSTQKRQITAVHEIERPRNDAVYLFAQRSVFPFDRGDASCFRVEQYDRDFAASRAGLLTVKRPDK